MGNPNVFRLIVTDDDLDLGHSVSVCDLPGLRVAAAHIVMCPSTDFLPSVSCMDVGLVPLV